MTRAAGPFGRIVETDGTALKPRAGYQLGRDANALVVLNRLAFPEYATVRGRTVVEFRDKTTRALLNWSAATGLGQHPELLDQVRARREHAIAGLRRRGLTVTRLRAVPEWRIAVGLGNRANAHEIGFSLHGTYGWPIIPGSTLKGLAASYARQELGDDDQMLADVFGGPRPGQRATRDTSRRAPVAFLDALPADGPATVAVDVLTPHVKPYYDAIEKNSPQPPPPAEYHNPVPVHFLTVTGPYLVDVASRDEAALEFAVDWLTRAGSELGVGAKTAAGYGYLAIEEEPT
ncbi:type III-B CRISPR module RAMP protein Cmr6 [Thermomonospora cellulosilytica]|uniref:CRISPR-associated protein Cmr6 n=1 Tax=Thermomonospora cellulosilytica TaxID=1411118 RepID=A0A7W3RCG5_9ACTN|nr:type III-B CRISPR module RAMP protein Cmr6 [Thermomonospora cellulosilytica]MBA9007290.1 CRISPR-associated protein Cmr6 [Thermomonospora cellulosilytica]